jgi:hypothetical protein
MDRGPTIQDLEHLCPEVNRKHCSGSYWP